MCGSQELSHERGTVESTGGGNGGCHADCKSGSSSGDGFSGVSYHGTNASSCATRRSETESKCHERNDYESRQYVTSTINGVRNLPSHTFHRFRLLLGIQKVVFFMFGFNFCPFNFLCGRYNFSIRDSVGYKNRCVIHSFPMGKQLGGGDESPVRRSMKLPEAVCI